MAKHLRTAKSKNCENSTDLIQIQRSILEQTRVLLEPKWHAYNKQRQKKLKIGQNVIKNKYDGFNNSLEICRGERIKHESESLNIHNSISECFVSKTSAAVGGSDGVCFTRLWLFEGTWGATIVCVTQKAFELLVSVSREKGLEVIIGLAGTTQRNRFGNIFGNKYLSSLFGQSTLLLLSWYYGTSVGYCAVERNFGTSNF